MRILCCGMVTLAPCRATHATHRACDVDDVFYRKGLTTEWSGRDWRHRYRVRIDKTFLASLNRPEITRALGHGNIGSFHRRRQH